MQKRPNVLIILADDLGIGDLGCYNRNGRIPTPHHDRFALQGRRFSDAHSNSAVCTPTRYGLLCGRYAFRTRLTKGVLFGYGAPLIESHRVTLPKLLQQAGYRTSCIGKWHLGLGWQHRDGSGPDADLSYSEAKVDWSARLTSGPHTVGFDDSMIISASLDMPPYAWIEDGRVVEEPSALLGEVNTCADHGRVMWRAGVRSPGFEPGNVLLEITRRSEAWISERGKLVGTTAEKPFFAYIPLPSPHTPHVPRAPFVGRSGIGRYGDFVAEHDWAVGQILAALDRAGLADDTLVIITSDNGAHASPLRLESDFGHQCNGPYRGQKSDAWDGGHRVPFLARWPGRIPAGTVCEETLCLTDVLRTCCGFAGVDVPVGDAEDSCDVSHLFLAISEAPRALPVVHHSIDGSFAIRVGRWKYITVPGSGGWSLPNAEVPADQPRHQLYDLANDPSEAHNLIGADGVRAATMHQELIACCGPEVAQRFPAGPSW
jgi:arylsulfatase A